MTKYVTFFSGLLGASLFVIASIVGGLQIEGYSPIGQYISESYATGIPDSEYLRYAFIASGILLFLFGLLAPNALPKSKGIKTGFILFAIFYGLGTLLTGIFPCDLGCPSDLENSSLSQFVHNTAGFLTYTLVPFCIIGLGISFGKFSETKKLGKMSLICGVTALVFMLLLFGNPSGPFIGLFQRILETSILTWIFYCSFFVLKTAKE